VLRALSLVVMLLALGIPTAQAGNLEVAGRAPALFSPRAGS